jgi:hypothetical protein
MENIQNFEGILDYPKKQLRKILDFQHLQKQMYIFNIKKICSNKQKC